MSYKITSEDREVTEHREYLPFGVNTVKLVGATAGETEAGKDYIELTVEADGIEDNARVWFTGGASKYSFQTIQQIVVHSAKTDSAKEQARLAVEKCVDTDEMANLLNSKCVGGELWVTKYYDPSRTYTNANGETKKSVNTNVYGYEPKLKPELMPEAKPVDTVHPVDDSSSASIPSEWS